MNELIIAGFKNAHTAFLARAALARMQADYMLNGRDIAMATFESDGDCTIREAIQISPDATGDAAFWQTIAIRLFPACLQESCECREEASRKLASIGIDEDFLSELSQKVTMGSSAIMVLADKPDKRDKIIGLLQGFDGDVCRTHLQAESRDAWLEKLSKVS